VAEEGLDLAMTRGAHHPVFMVQQFLTRNDPPKRLAREAFPESQSANGLRTPTVDRVW